MTDDAPEIMMLSTKTVYQNRWMTVREDIVERRDGSRGVYGVVEKNDFSLIVPIDATGTVYLVEQFRYPVGKRCWELPQGSWEEQAGVDPLELAHGELREETGLAADEMTYVGQLFEAYGYSTQSCHIFLARGLRPLSTNLDPEEQGLISRGFAIETVIELIVRGEIKDAATVAAFGLLRLKGLL
ncbi:NUDIX domain-containing protein [Pararhizobium sp.]|uniref:NUDIX domain-containing protein n=1 Tax=Pararhizobium sp. TaxID=1977563 RepID=UPI003D1141B3